MNTKKNILAAALLITPMALLAQPGGGPPAGVGGGIGGAVSGAAAANGAANANANADFGQTTAASARGLKDADLATRQAFGSNQQAAANAKPKPKPAKTSNTP